MKKFSKITCAILLCALVLTTLLIPMQAFAASYTYNWGKRGEVATSLSDKAKAFYTGSYTFANLSNASGGTGKSDAPNSALYKALKTLMTSKHSYQNSYSANNDLLKYTDCQNGGGKISSFYSGKEIGPNWGEGSWNKEHTWPNSKGLGGKDEDDIMMISPTATSENSSRGNTAYGKSSGYYDPNSESNGKYNLRGDCARIFLYVYTRWGNTNGNGEYATWGSRGVMESVEVLLEWMEEDPVDTWEMGRNDAVQSITGTRNAFVDYPEYAFLLFGKAVPSNYPTPSQSNGVTPPKPEPHTCDYTPATCTTPATCKICYQTTGSALGHTAPNAEGLCTRCGEVLEVKTTHAGTQADPYTVADALKLGATLNGGNSKNIIYVQGVVTSIGTVSSKGTYREKIVIKDSSTNQTLSINTANPNTSDELNIKVGDNLLLWGYLRTNNSSQMVEMGSVSGTYVYYSIVTGSQGGGTVTPPAHTCESKCPTCGGCTDASCTESACSTKCQGHQTTPPVTSGTSIDLTSASNKVSASSQKLEFATGSLKVTVDKAAATNDLIDKTGDGYAARVYQGATLTVEYSQMTKIVINCDGGTYNNKTYISGFDGMTVAGATITREGNTITIEFASATNKFVSTGLSSQTRILSIDVYTSSGGTVTPPVHTCQSQCPTCGGCTDASCTESACATKCQGHQTTPPVVTPDATVNSFKSAVANIQNATTMDAKFTAIKTAVELYNTMNAEQKAQVTAEFATLKTAVEDYNANATLQNANSGNAVSLALQIVSIVVALATAFVLLKKVF